MKWRPLLGLVVALASAGCGPSPADLARWEASEPDGLERLERVVVDRAAKPALRADAALLMIRAERRGRRPGLERLAEIVAHAPAADATPLLEQLVPRLSAEIRRDGAIDGIAEKDFAVLLLLDDAVAAAPLKAALRDAVLVWVRTATLARLAERRQRTSVPQAVRLLGAPAVEPFPALVGVPDAPLPLLATLVRDVGAPDTRAAMAGALIARDERLASPAGAAELRRAVDEANAKSGARPAAALVDAQLAKHRARVRGLVFEALIALGEPSARAHVVDRATAAAEPGEVRRAALAAMGVPAATLGPDVRDRVRAIAKDDAADVETRVAAAELLVDAGAPAATLYELFDARAWRVRFVAAEALLASPTLDVAEFARHLPAGDAAPMSVVEPLVYGRRLARRPGAEATLAPMRAGRALGPKLVALAALHERGEAAKAELARAKSDPSKVPACAADRSCPWTCQSRLGLRSGRWRVSTVGEFVEDCVLPSLGQAGALLPPAEPSEALR